MSFDAETFAASMRRALTSTPTDTLMPTAAPAPAPEPPIAKCDGGPFRWRLTPQRGPDQLIVSVLLEPVARAYVE